MLVLATTFPGGYWRLQPIIGIANAGQIVEEAGVMVCINDTWDEKELEKGHKLVDNKARCVYVPDDPAVSSYSDECVGKYEYMPDESWKGSGSCTETKDGDKRVDAWEEGSHLKEYTYKLISDTGKYEGIKGGGTYFYKELPSTPFIGGRYKGKMELP